MKVTLPVAEAGVTVAVRVTPWPAVEVVGVTETVVAVAMVEAPTDSVTALEVLPPFLESPP
jgi:hypothetical protein